MKEAVGEYAMTSTKQGPEVIHCVECEHLMFSDCYGECRLGRLTGPVRPEDFCGLGRRGEPHEL